MTKSFAIAALVLAAGAAAPIGAQPYPYPYPNPYPQQPYNPYPYPAYPTYPTYPQPGYGYGYGGNTGVLGSIIDNMIGNRWGVGDRNAIRQCTFAAAQQAEAEYRSYFGPNFRRPYEGYNGYIRVSAITDVQHRLAVIRVRGLLDTGLRRWQPYDAGGDLSFRCDVDYRGYVSNVRISRR